MDARQPGGADNSMGTPPLAQALQLHCNVDSPTRTRVAPSPDGTGAGVDGGDGQGRPRPGQNVGEPPQAAAAARIGVGSRLEGRPASPPAWQVETLRSRRAGECLDVLAERLSSLPGAQSLRFLLPQHVFRPIVLARPGPPAPVSRALLEGSLAKRSPAPSCRPSQHRASSGCGRGATLAPENARGSKLSARAPPPQCQRRSRQGLACWRRCASQPMQTSRPVVSPPPMRTPPPADFPPCDSLPQAGDTDWAGAIASYTQALRAACMAFKVGSRTSRDIGKIRLGNLLGVARRPAAVPSPGCRGCAACDALRPRSRIPRQSRFTSTSPPRCCATGQCATCTRGTRGGPSRTRRGP